MKPVQISNLPSQIKSFAGFTLIELMVTVAILAIVAAIAVPSYRAQIRKNAEEQARQQILSVANQLASWRSKRLSYAGFVPANDGCGGGVEACYSLAASGGLYVPLGTNATTHRYLLTIVDANPIMATAPGSTAPKSKNVPLNATSAVTGRGWRIKATPNSSNNLVKDADSFYMDSLGQRCRLVKAKASSVRLTDATINCSTSSSGISTW